MCSLRFASTLGSTWSSMALASTPSPWGVAFNSQLHEVIIIVGFPISGFGWSDVEEAIVASVLSCFELSLYINCVRAASRTMRLTSAVTCRKCASAPSSSSCQLLRDVSILLFSNWHGALTLLSICNATTNAPTSPCSAPLQPPSFPNSKSTLLTTDNLHAVSHSNDSVNALHKHMSFNPTVPARAAGPHEADRQRDAAAES